MDFLGKIVGGESCSAEGAASASNPLGQAVDTLLPLQHAGAEADAALYHDLYEDPDDTEFHPEYKSADSAPYDADVWAEDFETHNHNASAMSEAWQYSNDLETSFQANEEIEEAWKFAVNEPLSLEEGWREEGDRNFEGAWEESKTSAAPMAEAWDDAGGYGTREGMEAAWQRTQDRLESLEDNVEYELGDMNDFDAVENPFEEGVRLFDAGHLNQAVQAFEAAVRQDTSDAKAWHMLGLTHAENEEDVRAIQCLEKAVASDPYFLDALLALGVSYVNEMRPERALSSFKAWLEANPKFAALEVTKDEYSDGTLMDEVQSLMLQAAQHDPEDADVQVVLGVVYNVTEDYDSAVAAFRTALQKRPDSYSLRNKLGATLANANNSELGLVEYQTAIALKPKYARAWLNMGISYSNLNNDHEAARCFLQAIALNPMAKHIWAFLRVIFSNMGRYDLVEIAGKEDVRFFLDEFQIQTDGEAFELAKDSGAT